MTTQPLALASTEPGEKFLRAVEGVIREHHYKPDIQAARALFAAIAAHQLEGAAVWPMLVAPSGSLKTELLESLDGLPGIHFVDQITPKTFLSGQIEDPKKKPDQTSPSLLFRIGSGILVYPDFSTVLSMSRDNRGSVLADMRRIYDGHLRKEYGTADRMCEREWRGRITFAVAATPHIDTYYAVFQTLGERFVMIRWGRPGGVGAALSAMNQDRTQARALLKAAVHRMLSSLPDVEPTLSDDVQLQVAALAEFAVRARTHVPRVGYSKEIIYVPEPEAPTRLGQQLSQLAKGAALLGRRSVVSIEDLDLVRRVAFDCIPASRRKILDAMRFNQDLSETRLPASTSKYAIEELKSLELVTDKWLSRYAVELLQEARMLE